LSPEIKIYHRKGLKDGSDCPYLNSPMMAGKMIVRLNKKVLKCSFMLDGIYFGYLIICCRCGRLPLSFRKQEAATHSNTVMHK
jgi:hypothetical protein